MTIDNGLVIVPAGAGAGKTHHIQTTLADWVRRGVVRPERILAVTFTEAAAGELRERIRAGLLAEGLVSEALAVERAYVSTIHGLGLRLLTEHALAAGASPQPRPLADAEQDLLIRQALAHARSLDPVKADPARFGYRPSWDWGESVEDVLRATVLSMINLLRGLGDRGRDPGLIEPALARLAKVYGPVRQDAKAVRDRLETAILTMLDRFPEGGSETVIAASPRERLEKDLALFQRLQRDPSLLDRDWAAWESLRHLFVSNSRSRTPEGYDDLALAIIETANALPEMPGPLDDAQVNLRCLIACAQEVMEAYESRKKALGLIDYADMITGAERLLRTDPTVRAAVLDEIDCVIIDEFQDTSPVQFALLWQLGQHAPRTLLVGDVKQSIMGFQGADPRLSEALAAAYPSASRPLVQNWRSSPAVMDFINAVGGGLFGAAYTALAPTRPPVSGPALSVLRLVRGRTARNYARPPDHVAEHVARLLAAGGEVTDRRTGQPRPVRPSDIAVLVCRNATAGKYADALRARGLPVRIAEDGWARSRSVQIARAALAFTANPEDTHSALMIRTLGPDPLSLRDALDAQIEGQLADDPLLMQLAALSDQIATAPVTVALDLVIHAAGIPDWVARMDDAGAERADLLRLQAEALAFETAHRDLKAASGFYGETAKVFLGWLDARAGERDFDRRPDPSAETAEAVEVETWHSSKGREWPITVVAEFDFGIEERAGTTSIDFRALDRIPDMDAVLASARLVHTPGLVAPEAQRRFVENRRTAFETNARNLLYVALTRARDHLVLEWPEFLKARAEDAPEASCLFHVFEDACTPRLTGNSISIGWMTCPAAVRTLPDQTELTLPTDAGLTSAPRLGAASPLPATDLTPWRLQPSQMEAVGATPTSRSVSLGAAWPRVANDALRGTALHLALQTLLARPDLAEALPAATAFGSEELGQMGERAKALRAWLSANGFTELRTEVPVLDHTDEGAEIPGTIDLLAFGPPGCLVIDHKSGGSGHGLGPYWPQLSAYARLVRRIMPAHELRGAGIFWIDHGTLELVEFGMNVVGLPK